METWGGAAGVGRSARGGRGWCTGTATYFVVDATTWASYIAAGTNVSITDFGVYNYDKVSYVRLYNYSGNCWSIDVYNVVSANYNNFGSSCSTNANGTTFIEYSENGGATCNALGPWNIAEIFATQKFVGGVFTPVVNSDVLYNYASSPCSNSGTGAWWYASTVWGNGAAFSVCGPWKTECRP